MRQPYTKQFKNALHYAVQWEDERFGWHFVSVKYLRKQTGAISESFSVGEEILYKGKKEFPGKILSKEDVPSPEKSSSSKKGKQSSGKENNKQSVSRKGTNNNNKTNTSNSNSMSNSSRPRTSSITSTTTTASNSSGGTGAVKKPVVQPELQVSQSQSRKFNGARFKKFMKCLNAVFDKYQLQDIAIDTVTLDFQSSYPEYEDNEIADYLLEMEERNQLMITDKRIYKIAN